jgi:hypothetical protein
MNPEDTQEKCKKGASKKLYGEGLPAGERNELADIAISSEL